MYDAIAVADKSQAINGRLEVSMRGRWVTVPALQIDGQAIRVTGKRIKIASLHNEDWIDAELSNPDRCAQILRNHSTDIRADILRFSQKVPETTPRYPYAMELRSIAVTDVSCFKSWWESLPQVTRKNVRRAQKRGVVVEVKPFDDEVIAGIAEVQNETPMRQGRTYCHYGKSLEEVRRDHGEFVDRSEFICAYSEKEFIGFLKLVYRGDIASILQINSKIAHYDKRPANALMAKAAELCEARGISYLTYGLFNYGNKGNTPLREFKERHNFNEMLIPTYYVPLTTWGRICVKNKLYREPLEFLPRRAISTALNLRTRWYSFRSSTKPV